MYWMMFKGPFEYITGFYKEKIFMIEDITGFWVANKSVLAVTIIMDTMHLSSCFF
jgi:hypothetical protein